MMTDFDANSHLDHQRWLINNGFVNDLHKDTLFMYGAVLNKAVVAVELNLLADKKIVEYMVYVPDTFIKKLNKFLELKKSTSMLGLWRFKKMLETEGNLDLSAICNTFVKDYCGPAWQASLKIEDAANYKDELDKEQIDNRAIHGAESDKQPVE